MRTELVPELYSVWLRLRYSIEHAPAFYRPHWRSIYLSIYLSIFYLTHLNFGVISRLGPSRSLPPASQDPEEGAPRLPTNRR